MNLGETKIDLLDHKTGQKNAMTLDAFIAFNASGIEPMDVYNICCAIVAGKSYRTEFHMGGDYEIRRAQ